MGHTGPRGYVASEKEREGKLCLIVMAVLAVVVA